MQIEASLNNIIKNDNKNVIVDLQKQLQAEKEARAEDKFLYILIITILFNVTFFVATQNWTAPVILGVFELLFLLLIAKKLGIQEIIIMLDRIINKIIDKT